MAKFDTYVLHARVGGNQDYLEFSLTVLFEEGDVVEDVLANAREVFKTEGLALKRAKILNMIKQ